MRAWPGPLRIAVADGWYRVFGRGLERREIFRDNADRRHLLELLEVLHARYRVLIHADVGGERVQGADEGRSGRAPDAVAGTPVEFLSGLCRVRTGPGMAGDGGN
jgi:hypothetical protein